MILLFKTYLEAEKRAPLIYPSDDKATNIETAQEYCPINFSAKVFKKIRSLLKFKCEQLHKNSVNLTKATALDAIISRGVNKVK